MKMFGCFLVYHIIVSKDILIMIYSENSHHWIMLDYVKGSTLDMRIRS